MPAIGTENVFVNMYFMTNYCDGFMCFKSILIVTFVVSFSN